MNTSAPLAAEPESALQLLQEARTAFARLLSLPNYGGHAFPESIGSVLRKLIRAADREPDLLIASILHCQQDEYSVRHAMNVALVADHLLRTLGRDAAQRTAVIGAALTMNIAMHTLQELLAKQAGPLTPSQRQSMQNHPLVGRDTLRKLGISDPLWLDCVAQHHEMMDGSGYPLRLSGDALHFEARLIGMADRYCAMLCRAAWRREQLADNAMLTTLGPVGLTDTKLGRLFIESLGIYPAGSMVQLVNGEIAMVKQQGRHEAAPLVVSLFNALLDPISTPPLRDTGDDDFCIVGVLNHRKMGAPIEMKAVWGEEATI